jgi:hypothetical protein
MIIHSSKLQSAITIAAASLPSQALVGIFPQYQSC